MGTLLKLAVTIVKVTVLTTIVVCILLFILLVSFSALAVFGLTIAVFSAILVYSSPSFHQWLMTQPGYQQRLSKLPGLSSLSPPILAGSILLYLIPLSTIGWFFTPISNRSDAGSSGILGLIGLGLFYGWFIRGWRLKKVESEITAPKLSMQKTGSFLKTHRFIAVALIAALTLPFVCTGSSIVVRSEAEKASHSIPVDRGREDTPQNDAGIESSKETPTFAATSETDKVSVAVTSQPIHTSEPTATSTRQPTRESIPSPTPVPLLEVIVNSGNLRSGPGTNYDSIGTVIKSDILLILGKSSDGSWFNVRLEDGTLGWVGSGITNPVNEELFATIQVAMTVPPAPTQVVEQLATSPPELINTPASGSAAPVPPTETSPPLVAGITLLSLTSPINHGAYATLVIQVAPNAVCDPGVIYKSGESTAQGLESKQAGDNGQLSWTWKVGTRTTPGTWTVYVNCNPGGYMQWGLVVN